MTLTLRHFLPLLAVVVWSMPVEAQRIDSPYRFLETSQEAGVVVAYINTEAGTLGFGSESGPAFGGRYALRVSGPFSVDVEVLHFASEHAVLDTTVVDSAFQRIGTASHSLAIGTAAIRLNLTGSRTWHGILPFLAFGGGVAVETSRDQEEVDKAPTEARYAFGTTFAGSLGAGLQIFPSRRLAIRVDARNLLWKIKAPAALLRGQTGKAIPVDEWVKNLSASAGVSVHF